MTLSHVVLLTHYGLFGSILNYDVRHTINLISVDPWCSRRTPRLSRQSVRVSCFLVMPPNFRIEHVSQLAYLTQGRVSLSRYRTRIHGKKLAWRSSARYEYLPYKVR